MVSQQASAWEWVKASHERRQEALQQNERETPSPEHAGQEESLSAADGSREAHGPNYNELKVEHADRTGEVAENGHDTDRENQDRPLTFYEDRHGRDGSFIDLRGERAEGAEREAGDGREKSGEDRTLTFNDDHDLGRSR